MTYLDLMRKTGSRQQAVRPTPYMDLIKRAADPMNPNTRASSTAPATPVPVRKPAPAKPPVPTQPAAQPPAAQTQEQTWQTRPYRKPNEDQYGQILNTPDPKAKPVRHYRINERNYTVYSDGSINLTPETPPAPPQQLPQPQPQQQLPPIQNEAPTSYMYAALEGAGQGIADGARAEWNGFANAAADTLEGYGHAVDNVSRFFGGDGVMSDDFYKGVGNMRQDMAVDYQNMRPSDLSFSEGAGNFAFNVANTFNPAERLSITNAMLGKIPGIGRFIPKSEFTNYVGSQMQNYGERIGGAAGDAMRTGGTVLNPANALNNAVKSK